MKMHAVASRGALLALSLFWFTQPALAGPPQFFTFHFDRTVVDTQLCGFPIEAHDEGGVRLAFHFDKRGDIE